MSESVTPHMYGNLQQHSTASTHINTLDANPSQGERSINQFVLST